MHFCAGSFLSNDLSMRYSTQKRHTEKWQFCSHELALIAIENWGPAPPIPWRVWESSQHWGTTWVCMYMSIGLLAAFVSGMLHREGYVLAVFLRHILWHTVPSMDHTHSNYLVWIYFIHSSLKGMSIDFTHCMGCGLCLIGWHAWNPMYIDLTVGW